MQLVLVREVVPSAQVPETVPGMVVGPDTKLAGRFGNTPEAAVVAVKVAEVPEEASPTVMIAVYPVEMAAPVVKRTVSVAPELMVKEVPPVAGILFQVVPLSTEP
jgi:hypothetical protein